MLFLPVRAEDVKDFLLVQVEAEGFHGDFELVVVDVAVLVEIEELELCGDVNGHSWSMEFAFCWEQTGVRGALTASLISSLCSSLRSAISARPASARRSRSARSARSRSMRCASRCWCVAAPKALEEPAPVAPGRLEPKPRPG